MRKFLAELPAPTDHGVFMARYSEKGLAELDFPRASASRNREGSESLPAPVRSWHRLTEAALAAVLAGKKPRALPPLDWEGATEFQKAVWREMLKIPPGKTQSYGEVARAIGRPKAVRAVGSACGANPVPVLVPCHRILAAGGKIGGFGGGLQWKRELLAREGVNPPPSAG
ncbi:MAG TPA: methylated-DNA--[protein]-cysteine S-methyltransferase [Verrucomicrobiae bacterium]|nr:methylated-DNA--[protein]-cysteine S-methyltransferase [Verrucomicrobiae bacterium]